MWPHHVESSSKIAERQRARGEANGPVHLKHSVHPGEIVQPAPLVEEYLQQGVAELMGDASRLLPRCVLRTWVKWQFLQVVATCLIG